MLMLGIPPHLALAVLNAGTPGAAVGSFPNYYRAGKVLWRVSFILAGLSLVGVTVGTSIVIRIESDVLHKIIGLSLMAMVPLLLINRELGVKHLQVSKKKRILGYIFYSIMCIGGGILAVGAGIVFVQIYMFFFGLTVLETKGTATMPGVVGSIAGTVVFAISGIFNWHYVAAFFPGMMLGAWLGSKTALRLGDKKLKYLIIALVAAIGLYLFLRS